MTTIDLEVQGMSCGSCVKHVTEALQLLTGVSGVKVDLPTGHVLVSGEFEQGSERLVSTLTAAGYPAKLATSSAPIVQSKASGCCSGSAGRGGCCG